MNREDNKNVEKQMDRWVFPSPMKRVTGGPGGEAILILGSEKTALYDCGMACFADKLIENISKELVESDRKLDYVLLSHTHYDHIGGLSYVLKRWPEAVVCGSQKAKQVLENQHALNTMKHLGEVARKNFNVENFNISVEGMKVERVLEEGDVVSLGEEKIIAYETKGHTDCSMSFYILPEKIMLASESTGVYAPNEVIYTQPLKSVSQTIEAAKKLEDIEIDCLIIPHYGIYFGDKRKFFEDYIKAATAEKDYILDLFRQGETVEEALKSHEGKYWPGGRVKEQPYEAYKLNAEILIRRLYSQWERESSDF